MKSRKQPNKTALSNSRKHRTDLIMIVIFSLLFLCCYFYSQFQSHQLDTENEYTTGIIVGYQGVAKGDCNIKFCYYVNNVKYTSFSGYSIKYDKFSIGDTCFVKYARSNPVNSELVKIDVNGHKVIKYKPMIRKITP